MYAILWKEFKETFYNLFRVISTFITPMFLLIFFAVVFATNMQSLGYKGIEVNYIQFFTPGLFAYLTFLLFSLTFAIVRLDRVHRTIAVILVSGTSLNAYFWGKIFANIIVTFLKVFPLMLIAYFVGGGLIPIQVLNLFLFSSGMILGSMFWSSLGFLAAVLISREDLRDIIFMFLTMPITFASTMYYNLDRAPHWIKIISSINPLTYTSNIIRQSFLFVHPVEWSFDLLYLIVFVLIACSLAIFSLRRLTI